MEERERRVQHAEDRLAGIQRVLRDFAQERDWQQFHTPKNLAIALAVEASELLEIFQWLDAGQSQAVMTSPEDAARVHDELADIFGYLLRISDVLEVDLVEALISKIDRNHRRYPVELAKGNSKKADRL